MGRRIHHHWQCPRTTPRRELRGGPARWLHHLHGHSRPGLLMRWANPHDMRAVEHLLLVVLHLRNGVRLRGSARRRSVAVMQLRWQRLVLIWLLGSAAAGCLPMHCAHHRRGMHMRYSLTRAPLRACRSSRSSGPHRPWGLLDRLSWRGVLLQRTHVIHRWV